MAALQVDKITIETFRATLSRYGDVASSALADLDMFRYETVPAKLASMKGDEHLLKADVERLVEWKLKHGTFRPSLMNLVKSNPADLIMSTSQSAFSNLDHDKDVLRALKQLATLRGIGPATASLLLSVYQPETVPFFSDELFRWTHWDGTGAASGGPKAGAGWERKIKYNVKEYESILERVKKLRNRLGVGATEMEKVAYVLGKEQADIEGKKGREKKAEGVERNVDEESDQKKRRNNDEIAELSMKDIAQTIRASEAEVEARSKTDGNAQEDEAKASGSQAAAAKDRQKKGTKRKAREFKEPSEGARRSARRKI